MRVKAAAITTLGHDDDANALLMGFIERTTPAERCLVIVRRGRHQLLRATLPLHLPSWRQCCASVWSKCDARLWTMEAQTSSLHIMAKSPQSLYMW